jgi:hypothetical protein
MGISLSESSGKINACFKQKCHLIGIFVYLAITLYHVSALQFGMEFGCGGVVVPWGL